MRHQPFEHWILDPDQTTPAERRALQGHLAACAQCDALQRKWQGVQAEIRAQRMVASAPGFTGRWRGGLAERRAREQRRQAWRIFGFLLGGALTFLVALAGYMMATTSLAQWLAALVQTVSSSQVLLQMVIYVVQMWFARIPLALNIALWMYLTFTLCALCLIWLGILWHTKTVGVLEA